MVVSFISVQFIISIGLQSDFVNQSTYVFQLSLTGYAV